LEESEYIESNRRLWNEKTRIHVGSEFYGVEGFKRGKSSLHSIELEELGDVAGKSLLHLQCHFGLDTFSWARLGARVTGVDFSDEAIAFARTLSRKIGVAAEFVCSNIYDLPEMLNGEFEIVFTSYGVLCWLPDLWKWASVISHFLKPGGTFYIVESHPFANVFDDGDVRELKIRYPYYGNEKPMHFPPGPTYADKTAKLRNPSYEWSHSLGEIVNSLLKSGLGIEFFHEFPFTCFQALPFLVQGEDGWWRLPDGHTDIPLLFSLMAKKG
jgi:SAM-dependent methyltransferase